MKSRACWSLLPTRASNNRFSVKRLPRKAKAKGRTLTGIRIPPRRRRETDIPDRSRQAGPSLGDGSGSSNYILYFFVLQDSFEKLRKQSFILRRSRRCASVLCLPKRGEGVGAVAVGEFRTRKSSWTGHRPSGMGPSQDRVPSRPTHGRKSHTAKRLNFFNNRYHLMPFLIAFRKNMLLSTVTLEREGASYIHSAYQYNTRERAIARTDES
jgi:hypothetical protein